MSLGQLVNIVEFLGGVAVVVTLIYLAVQVRQSRREVETANNQAQADAHARYLTAVATDPELSHAFAKVLWTDEQASLTSEEEERMLPLLHAAFTQFEIGFYNYDQGLMRGDFKDHLANALGG